MSENPEFSLKSVAREKELWILLLLTILFFYRPLFMNDTFFFRDLYNHFYPQKKLLVDLIKSGEIPLWDPYRHGGQPFIGNMNNAAMYPGNLIYFLLPVTVAFNIDIVLHVLLAAAASYVLARSLLFQPKAAMISGIIFAFSGPALSIPNVWLYAPCHLPLVLFFWDRYLLERKFHFFVLAAVMGIVQLLAGRPEMVAVTLLTLLIWTLFRAHTNNSLKTHLISWMLICLVIIAGAAIQLLPMLEIVSSSSRVHGTDYRTFSAWSVHPKRLPELIFPQFFGVTYRLAAEDYWGYRFEDLGMPYLLSIYFGIPALVLAFRGALSKISHERFNLRLRRCLLALAVVVTVFSLGRFLPFFQFIYEYVPLVHVFRYPVKLLIFAILPVSLLAGFGAKILFEHDTKLKRSRLMLVGVVLAAALLIFSALLYFTDFKQLVQWYFLTTSNAVQKNVALSIFHSAILLFALTLLIGTRGKLGQRFQYLIIALFVVDLFNSGAPVNHYAPREFFTSVPALAEQVKREIGNGRLYRSGDRASLHYFVPENDTIYVDRWRMEMLSNYIGTFYEIPVIFHEDYDRMEWRRLADLSEKLRHSPWPNRLPALSAAGVKMIISDEVLKFPQLKLISGIKNRSNTPYYLYKNTGCSFRTRFVQSSRILGTEKQVIETVTNPAFDPCKQVLIEKDAQSAPFQTTDAKVTVESLESRIQHYAVTNSSGGYLVFSETNYPGWHLRVDGKEAESFNANFAFSATYLNPGEHHIERRYSPVSFKFGALISLLTFAALSLCGFLIAKLRKKEEAARITM